MRQANDTQGTERIMIAQATPHLKDWSDSSIKEYLAQDSSEPFERIDALLEDLRALADRDLDEAARRVRTIVGLCSARAISAPLMGPDPVLVARRRAVRQEWDRASDLGLELGRRREQLDPRPKRVSCRVPRRLELEEALAKIDRGAAREASNVSEKTAFGIFLQHGLITREQYDRARDRPGNTMWDYAGH
jgi:hypothetical protein